MDAQFAKTNMCVNFYFSIRYLANSSEDKIRRESTFLFPTYQEGFKCPDCEYQPVQSVSCDIMNLLPPNIQFAAKRDIKSIAEIEEFGNKDVAFSHLFNGFETSPSQRIRRRCNELRGIMDDPKYKNWGVFVILEEETVVGAAIIVVPPSSTSYEQVIVSLRYA